MENKSYQLVKPEVSFSFFKIEIVLITLSLITPLVAFALTETTAMFARSGSIMVFFAASSEFALLNKANNKHLLNSARVLNNETPWSFSKSDKVISILSLSLGLVGTVIWGYGDLL